MSDPVAADPDQALLDAFRQWCAAEAAEPSDEDDVAGEQIRALDDMALAIAIMPVAGMTGLSIKLYMALHAEAGGSIENPLAIDMRHWHEGQFSQDLIAGALADMMRLNPAIAAIVGTAKFV